MDAAAAINVVHAVVGSLGPTIVVTRDGTAGTRTVTPVVLVMKYDCVHKKHRCCAVASRLPYHFAKIKPETRKEKGQLLEALEEILGSLQC